MNAEGRKPILVLRAKGPATEGGRMLLADLMKMGKQVQTAIERVARVLVGQSDSRRPGRKPQEIARDCALEVVAMNDGSFELVLDLPRRRFETMDLGVEAMEKLFLGWDEIGTNGNGLPAGYDTGVLFSLRELGQLIGSGIDKIEVESHTQAVSRSFCFDQGLKSRIVNRVSGPVTNLRTLEGRLLMADFRHDRERCRIHPPAGEPITCQFDESLEETVYDLLRKYVRVRGETQEDPATGHITNIHISDIEALAAGAEDSTPLTAEDFWQEKTLEQLAAEQGVEPIRRLEDVLGKGSDLWNSDEDFDAFLAAIETSDEEEA